MWADLPHFEGGKYFFPGDTEIHGLAAVLKWKLTGQPVPWAPVPPLTPLPAPPRPAEGLVVTWIGHASFLVQSPTATFLIDPVFSARAGPTSWLGAKRVVGPGLDLPALPKIDAVLLSHDHYDHCDLASLRRIARDHAPVLVSPLGYRSLLGRLGWSRHVELDWWQEFAGESWSVALSPSRHWCRRLPWDTNTRLWGGFFLRAGGRKLYFVGDSGYHADLFKEIGRRLGSPDLALIPIGAYEPRWFMADAHMNPAEAVRVHRDVGSARSIGIHWGTFRLTDEGREDPVRDLALAVAEQGLDPVEFTVLAPGGSVKG